MTPINPTPTQFRRGVLVFRKHEARDAMYRVAAFLVEQFWGRPRDLADGVGVLLLTWNQAFYRYGPPDLERFEKFLVRNAVTLQKVRSREISTLSTADDTTVESLFGSALEALEIPGGKNKGRRSPVAVAKALHLLAPSFFPLSDAAISRAYSCSYSAAPVANYLRFMRLSREMVSDLRERIVPLLDGKTPLKVLDEYNYAKFTKEWV
ncbi:MAG: hypothetical protein ACE5JQ_17535 [Candidatus Methylomirabilales bacterium]